MRSKWRTLTVNTEYPRANAVAPMSKSANGITMPRLCSSPSSLPASSAVSRVYGYGLVPCGRLQWFGMALDGGCHILGEILVERGRRAMLSGEAKRF